MLEPIVCQTKTPDGINLTYGRSATGAFFIQKTVRGMTTREHMSTSSFIKQLSLHGVNDPAMRAIAVQ